MWGFRGEYGMMRKWEKYGRRDRPGGLDLVLEALVRRSVEKYSRK
jgi:hypothetical protein